jgi:hypothetical protein
MPRFDRQNQWVIHPYNANDLVRPYRPGIEFCNFPDLDQRLTQHYDKIYDTVIPHLSREAERFLYETGAKIAFRDIFYAIDLVYENNPSSVIDMGSGICFWKKWFPNIYSVDQDPTATPDEVAMIDDTYCDIHRNRFDAGINICGSRTQNEIKNMVLTQMQLVRDRCLFTLSRNNLRLWPTANPWYNLNWVINEVYLLAEKFDLIMLDVPYLRGVAMIELDRYSHINGSVRFILAHKHSESMNE